MQVRTRLRINLGVLLILCVVAGTLLPSTSALAEICQSPAALSTLNQNNDLVVGQITIRTGDLFNLSDPKQGQFVHSVANAMHWATREKTIADTLPFRRGDAFSVDLLAEGERLLLIIALM